MSSDQVYFFSHTLLRDAALSLLSRSERDHLHAVVISLGLPENGPSADLSLHLSASPDAALAGQAAAVLAFAKHEVSRGNNSEALNQYERLASLRAAPTAERLEGMLQDARLQERSGRQRPALAMAKRAVKLAEEQGNAAQRGRAKMRLGALLRRRGDFKQALETLLEAESLSRTGNDSNAQADSVVERGMVHQATGALERADECFVAGERLFRRKGNLDGVCRALGNLALVHGLRGQHEAALAALDEAAELAEILNNSLMLARIMGNRANVLSELGELERAIQAHHGALKAFQACGDARGVATTHVNLGGLLQQTDDLDGADAHYAMAQRQTKENGDAVLAARVTGNRGILCHVRGDARGGRAFYAQALAQAQSLGDRAHEMHLLTNIGRSWQAEHQFRQALEALESALEIAHSQGQAAECAVILALQAQVLLVSGNTARAQQCALDALDWCDKGKAAGTHAQFEALVVLARYEQEMGNSADAGMLAREAQEVAAGLPNQTPADAKEIATALQSLRGMAVSVFGKEPKNRR